MRILRRIAILAALACAVMSGACAMTREELRAAWNDAHNWSGAGVYLELPGAASAYSAGSLNPQALADACDYLNFLRKVAGLTPVTLREEYLSCCQRGAVLTARWDFVSHDPDQPQDMDDLFYEEAYHAASSSNIVRINWLDDAILRTAVAYFVRDDGEENLSTLGHRRWALNPRMGQTGFGLANADSGMSYVYMYAHDQSADAGDWDSVCWPAAGAFPAEMMEESLAWSAVLNPEKYDLGASDVRVTLTERTGGEQFSFPGDGYFAVDLSGYGAGPCVIFRPDRSGQYVQNQIWDVEISGLVGVDSEAHSIVYSVEMAALYPVDPVGVELSQTTLAMRTGDCLALEAAVIPAWADDVSVTWSSTDPAVARVDANGNVEAAAPGTCEIHALSSNGRLDACVVTVEP